MLVFCYINTSMKKQEKQTNVRLTPEAKRLLDELAKKLGISQTAVIEIAIRKLAAQENLR